MILALKPVIASGSYLLRVINYAETPSKISIRFMHPVKRIQNANLNDEPLGNIILDENLSFLIRIDSWEIKSFMVTPAKIKEDY